MKQKLLFLTLYIKRNPDGGVPMKKILAFILCFVLILCSCSAENEAEKEEVSSSPASESSSSVSPESSVPEEPESASVPEVPFDELSENENGSFRKVEISCFYTLNLYALTDSGNLYRFDYTDGSMEFYRAGVADFWAGSFYEEESHYGGPNMVFENGWAFAKGEYYYKPDFTAVAGDYFLRSDGKIEYIDEGEWKILDVNAKTIKAREPGSVRFLDYENNLYRFTPYIEEPLLLNKNVTDYDWNFFDKINYADETICILEDGKIDIIFDEEFSDPETFLSVIPETAKKVHTSSGYFLFQKEDGTYLYGHKKHGIIGNIDIVGTDAHINFRDYAIIGADGNIYLHIEDLTFFGEAIDDNYTVTHDFIIELP